MAGPYDFVMPKNPAAELNPTVTTRAERIVTEIISIDLERYLLFNVVVTFFFEATTG